MAKENIINFPKFRLLTSTKDNVYLECFYKGQCLLGMLLQRTMFTWNASTKDNVYLECFGDYPGVS